jgi:hypothetical protein
MALTDPLNLVQPYTTPFLRWASDLTEQLASYNPPSPVDEDSWRPWAEAIAGLPEISELGAQNPALFGSWQDWAASLQQALS